jgi:hypothetical protein
MQTNALPLYDMSDNPTGCCPCFNEEGWDGVELVFKDKPFLRAVTHSVMHVPIDMGRVFNRVFKHMQEQDAVDPEQALVLSHDRSAWNAEHLFAVTKPVETEEMTTLTGTFRTKLFEGPYRNAKDWYDELERLQMRERGEPGRIYFFYTTCPKCAKTYGRNPVVGVYEI